MIRVGDGGWYSYMGDSKYASNDALFRELPQIRSNLESFTSSILIDSRVAIVDRKTSPLPAASILPARAESGFAASTASARNIRGFPRSRRRLLARFWPAAAILQGVTPTIFQ